MRLDSSRNKLSQKSGVPYKVKILGKVDSRKDRSRTRNEFVKPIRNIMKKIKSLMESYPIRAEREQNYTPDKVSQNRMTRSNSLEKQVCER